MSFLNRFRGGGFGAEKLPGHPRFWVTPVIALALWPLMGPLQAVVAALCYLAWCFPPWGLLMCLGRFTPPREISKVETTLLKWSMGNIHVAFGLRHLLGLIPAAVLLTPWALLAAPFIVLAYEIGWRWTPKAPIQTGELITGALWGLIFLATL